MGSCWEKPLHSFCFSLYGGGARSMAFWDRLWERMRSLGAEMPRSRTLMLFLEVIWSHWMSQAGVDQMAALVEAARRARMVNSTVWMAKRMGAIHATMAKKTVWWQEPSTGHPNEGVAAERAMAATGYTLEFGISLPKKSHKNHQPVWKQVRNKRAEISTRTELAL